MAEFTAVPEALNEFLSRGEISGAAERANYALFLSELCDVLEVPRPEPSRPDDAENAYVFERAVPFLNPDGSTAVKRIDLYRRACFVLEAKQSSDRLPEGTDRPLLAAPRRTRRGTAVRGSAGWDAAMVEARGQAEQYIRHLPAREPNPPFLVVVDVGHTFELFADFTRQGRTYVPFPDPASYRIRLRELADATIRDRLARVWTEPLSLDPSRRAARVTRAVAERLARLAQSLERSGPTPEAVAQFLMRCLFTFFAEDVGLLPAGELHRPAPRPARSGRDRDLPGHGRLALGDDENRRVLDDLAYSCAPLQRRPVRACRGVAGLGRSAWPIDRGQRPRLAGGRAGDFRHAPGARALDPIERHKLGAHYTPRAYVERLVLPTIIEPLREQWANVQAATITLAKEGDLADARGTIAIRRSFPSLSPAAPNLLSPTSGS